MAESFVFEVAHSLLGKLASYAYEEASRAYGVYDDLQRFINTLSIVKDVLDGFESQNKQKQNVKASGSIRMKVGHFFSSHNPLLSRIRMAHQIKDVRDKLEKVVADGNRFGLLERTIDVDPKLVLQKRDMTYSHVDASGVIGRENDREEIVQLLMQPHPHGDGDGDKSLCVIPIVGIGGLGKTTLAKLVFNDKRMDQLFQLKMWVSLSHVFDIREIVIKIIKSASAPTSTTNITHAHQEDIDGLDTEQLVSHLIYKLYGQKFLLVLDDIWNDDRSKWIELKDLIKVGAIGSKILVTTRNNSIASMMGTVDPYVLKGLSPENCLSLFVKWAFKEEKWEFVRDSELWNLEQKKDDILPALKLSYDEMPSHLRHCFTYFSLFPKDYDFDSKLITKLWLGHGLLQSPYGSQKTNDIAREYIDGLYSRSFIQDFEVIGHNVYFFKVHDLVHDLAMYVAKEEFVVVNSHTHNIAEQVRHISILETSSLGHALFPKSRSVRTILFPIERVGLDSETLLDTWLSRYKYLRYLDLSDSSFETLPNSIAELEHLQTLLLTNNYKIKRLPPSISKLHNLQRLSLWGCMELETLPKGIGKLISLRELYITTKQSVLPQNEFASFTNLQALAFYGCDNLKILFNRA
ncbi:P-loop containing nucleoside triphosphate hydrolase [Sesbania bispinosa]|nr:P-loop containing nucleoside triphosphate hydrolase [Sesbania bispinosa]